jgi:hypothetical protein
MAIIRSAMKKYTIYSLALVFLLLSITVATTQEQSRTIVMKIGEKTATVDDKSVTLQPAPTIIEERTVVPLRFLIDNVFPKDGSSVDYDTKEKKITITIPDISVLKAENLSLQDENRKLKQALADCIKNAEEGGGSTENLVPPIKFSKNGVDFTLVAIVKEKNNLRLDIKIYNKLETKVRFPASLTKMIVGQEKLQASDWDPIFSSDIPSGAERSGWVRLPLKTLTGVATFEFTVWPKDVLLYYTFQLKVNLDQAIPTSVPPSTSLPR